ncbi:hypothetical protein [Clostridium brassicae]|uniref:Flagellar hook-length control protein FliK n=1 Tax=Clostridium brassicae TaxID=2999072 RepID=A0ABT4D9D8_9CLOT|nr:hypothetical protein [Clostridium brassicae]MCY6958922.1 hypothetical protein [Clostridium brassicae]
MGGILNINSANNVDLKKMHKKLSFEIGEKFSARIIDFDDLSSEIMLKLLDGWQFSAQIDKSFKFTPNAFLRFQVEGYEDGKLVLKLLENDSNDETKSLFEDILEKQGIKVNKEDFPLLEKMLKHKMPLTKENISNIKTLTDFQDKIIKDASEEDAFILKYLDNKGINLNSDRGQNIKNILKGFFSQFKKLTSEELFTLIENNIDLTESNISSFNKIVKEPMALYKEVMELKDEIPSKEVTKINSDGEVLNNKSLDLVDKDTNIEDVKVNLRDNEAKVNKEKVNIEDKRGLSSNDEAGALKENNESSNSKNTSSYIEKIYNSAEAKEADGKEILNKLLGIDSSEKENNESVKSLLFKDKEIEHLKLQNKNVNDDSNKIKEQINDKLDEIKDVIKQIVREELDGKSEVLNKLTTALQSKINNFKIYNSISNQYYYLDVPVNLNEKEYPCKLIIKDERNKGKKIDSSNVKLVASVKTINMGVVDAYIKVFNKNLDIKIKCEKEWMKLIDTSKNEIINKLNSIGYISNVNVEKNVEKADIVKCRSFFEDDDFTSIDTMV